MDDIAVEITGLNRRQTVSEHYIDNLEAEIKDLRQLITTVFQLNNKVDRLEMDMEELKANVIHIASRPGKW